MAQIGVAPEYTDKRKVAGSNTDPTSTPANYVTHTALNTRLTAINGTYFSAANLNLMGYNDKVYALRLNDDAGSI